MNLFRTKVEVEFLKNFTSPVIGNVWVGRRAMLDKKIAERFIAGGNAKLLRNEAPAPATAPEQPQRRGRGRSSGEANG